MATTDYGSSAEKVNKSAEHDLGSTPEKQIQADTRLKEVMDSITVRVILDAVAERGDKQSRQLNQRIYVLESKLQRFDKLFEQVFQEEVKSRMQGKLSGGEKGCELSPDSLDILRQRLRSV